MAQSVFGPWWLVIGYMEIGLMLWVNSVTQSNATLQRLSGEALLAPHYHKCLALRDVTNWC
jgi:hypothetical protein